MHYLLYNLSWMIFNVLLALFPVVFTMILKKRLDNITTVFVYVLWLLFLPNTIYLLTDLQHLPRQLLRVETKIQTFLIIQYSIITIVGIATYIYSLSPLGSIIKITKIKNKNLLYICINFIVAFGVVLGKFQRTHSLYVITDPLRVLRDIKDTATTPYLIFLTILFGLIFTFIHLSYLKFVNRNKKTYR